MRLAIEFGEPTADFLAKTTFEGVPGSWKFGPEGVWNGYHQVIKKIENGRPVTL